MVKSYCAKRLIQRLLSLLSLLLVALKPALALTPIAGNGIIVDDIARDIVCAHGRCQSKMVRQLLNHYTVTNRNLYIFADFAAILDLNNIYQPIATRSHCQNPKNQSYLLDYQAEPIAKGRCLSGHDVTRFYRNALSRLNNVMVVPVFHAKARQLNLANPLQLKLLAFKMARLINGDVNAWGVALDVQGGSLTADSIEYFIKPLAKTLEGQNKWLSLFPANKNELIKIHRRFQNIIVLKKLYHFSQALRTDITPLSLRQYRIKLTRHIQRFIFDYGQNLPVMFVLPAAATNDLWHNFHYYNTYEDNIEALEDNKFANIVKKLCQLKPLKPVMSALNRILKINIKTYLNQCLSYQQINRNIMQDYFRTALNAVQIGFQNAPQARGNYLGSVLNEYKAKGYYGLSCAIKGVNVFHDPALIKGCPAYYPETISDWHWQTINRWSPI